MLEYAEMKSCKLPRKKHETLTLYMQGGLQWTASHILNISNQLIKDETMKYFMRSIRILALVTILFSCKETNRPDKIILDRIEYIYNLKSLIDKNTWPDFSNPKYDVPLVYYTDSCCYVANPTDNFRHLFNPALVYKNQTLSIYKTGLLDSIPFHMATGITFGDSTSDYNYKVPFMNCSSPELTNKFVPDVHSTEMWATMVMHEYFHGFQFKHPQFLDLYKKNVTVSADSLKALYNNNDWFKKSVDRENELLLEALNSDTQTEIQQTIVLSFKLRDQRLKQTKELLNLDIKTSEENQETMEGTARYIEYNLYSKFATMQPDMNLEKSDSLYHSYKYFKNYTITKDKWLYTAGAKYYYATGFNIARLLDKLKVDYKSRLFSNRIFLDEILREQIAKQ